MQTVPFTACPAQTFTTTLGDLRLDIAARYNDRNGVWTFDIKRSVDSVALLSSVPILIGQDMLAPYALGIGPLFAVDASGASLDAGPDDLGGRVTVVWFSVDELAQLIAAGA